LNSINISSLGFYDYLGNGLGESHQVGIWTDAGVLKVSATVDAGTLDPLSAGFRYQSTLIGTTLLTPGTYRIGAAYLSPSSDNMVNGPAVTSFTTAPDITYIQNAAAFGVGFSFPNSCLNCAGFAQSFFGPNFQYNPAGAAPVPEPATFGLFSA